MRKPVIMTERQTNTGSGNAPFLLGTRMERLVEDAKVVSSASIAVFLDYTQAINSLLTVLVTICTLIYVSCRAYREFRRIFWEKEKHDKQRNSEQ